MPSVSLYLSYLLFSPFHWQLLLDISAFHFCFLLSHILFALTNVICKVCIARPSRQRPCCLALLDENTKRARTSTVLHKPQ